MGQPAARVGDLHTCPMVTGNTPHVGGPITGPGCPTVLIGGKPAARVGDMCTCVGPPDAIADGEPTVFIGGRPTARMSDSTVHGGRVATGLSSVLIGKRHAPLVLDEGAVEPPEWWLDPIEWALLIGAASKLLFRGASAAISRLATASDEAVFYTGLGRNGAEKAAEWAAKNGGQTLDSTLMQQGIKMPKWDPNNPASVAAWTQTSKEFAKQASGNVRVLQGEVSRLNPVWKDEFYELVSNPKVQSITSIDPKTGTEVLLWSK